MKFNLSKKLLAGFFSVLLLLAAVTVVTVIQFTTVDKNYSDSIDDSFKKLSILTDMENAVLKEQITVRGYLANGDEGNIEEFNRVSGIFSENANKFLQLDITTEVEQVVEEFIEVESKYNQLAQQLIELKRQEKTKEIATLMKEQGNGLTQQITEVGEKARTYQETNIEEVSSNLSAKAKASKTSIIIISVFAMILGVIIALYISRIISKPVKQISKSAQEIASGNLVIDELKVKNNDEIGELAASFNQMTINLRDLIVNVSGTSEQVASSAEELMASAEQTTTATHQVTTAIQEVASGSEVQGKATEESATAISEMSIGIGRIADTSSSVAESASDTTNQATIGNDMLQKVVGQMKSINNSTNETNSVIKELDTNSNEIGKIIDVITDIAEQTNLLALNAAIESARAGEHGKGFAVVADEVRKLAEQSRHSASQISSLVQFIQSDVVKVVEMMNNSTQEVDEGMILVEDTGKSFASILTSIENVSGEVQELSAVSEQMSASMEQVNASINEVSNIAKTSAASTSDIASSSEEQLATMEEVTASASNLADMAEDLREMIRKFRV
ncbi:methyl-accepting chemotaxis protein [Aquibacillus kalidii]|uniref:methyl-accepting chemotaxis protein n=1 Tax=Aquibacillus kalidii TaxID=2762597 RepID=UPI001647292F|nr:methyl-accepting chemotaxis protein [Aquibacillus kalidii]